MTTDKELEDLKYRRDRLWRELMYLDGQIFRAEPKGRALSQEECSRISKLIGSKVGANHQK